MVVEVVEEVAGRRYRRWQGGGTGCGREEVEEVAGRW